jgi:F-type H+-transporting ATPase subunit b
MEIVPDPTIAVLQALPFLVTFVALYFILFKPLLQYLAEREEASTGARAEAAQLGVEVAQRLETLEERLATARAEIGNQRADARARAHQKETEVISAARDAAEKRVESALAQLDIERQQASKALRDTADTLAVDIAGQVLGRQINV